MKKYPAYKESDVDWIDEVPSHWTISRIKNAIAYSINGIWGDDPKEDGADILCIRVADFEMKRLGVSQKNLTNRCIPIRDDDQRILKKGDLLIEKSGGGEKQPVGRVISYDLNNKAVSSNFIAKIAPNNDVTDSGFLLYSFNVIYSFGINNLSIKQTTGIQNLNTTHYFNNQFCFPPLVEQTCIASFLKHKTSQIYNLITKKQKLIELLKEESTALINKAVTKGFDPNVPMKDSGIEWLGEIPEHWKIIPLKYLIKDLKSGVSVNSAESPIIDGEVGILKTSCVYNYYFDPTENKKVLPDELNRVSCPVEGNRIIISRMNTPDLVGASGFVEKAYPNLFLPDRLWLAELNDSMNFDTKWLSIIFISQSFRELLSSKATGTSPSMKNISKDDLLTIKVPMPSKDEQEKIKSSIETFKNTNHDIINRIEKEIELLNEYKTSLINETVTGKIDVRDYHINHA